MAEIGDAYIDVHANTEPFERELPHQLEEVATRSEKQFNKTGGKIGDDVSNGMERSIRRRGKSFSRAIEDSTKNTTIQVRSFIRFDRLRNFIRRRFRRDVGESISDEIANAIESSGRSGVFSKLTQGIADAVGAGFNVSGQSPLIALLIPALAALVGVILAAVQAVNALVAVLYILPGLLASIGLQVGVVMVAFQGMGTAIKDAFAAKNPKELREALKGLTPAARDFVKELLPLRDLFKQIQKVTQQAFFAELEGAITAIRKSLGPSLIRGFEEVAGALGKFFESFAVLLASPGFRHFFQKLIPATVKWLDGLAHSLFGKRGFITSLLALAMSIMPFMEKFGEIILRNLDHLSGLIFQLATSPETQTWLDRMAATLQLIFDLLFKVGEFLFVFMRALDEQGGQNLFTALEEALDEIMFFLASPAGAKAMEGLVNLGIIGIKALAGLVIAILGVVAAFQYLAEQVQVWAEFIGVWIERIVQWIINAATFIGVWIERIVGAIGRFAVALGAALTSARNAVVGFVQKLVDIQNKWIEKLKSIPGQILNVFKNFGTLLLNAGRALIQGLIDGINQKKGELMGLIHGIIAGVAAVMPGSPAKEGPLSGHGYVKFRGQRMMQDFIEGVRSEVPDLREVTTNAVSNIMFGPNSVQVNVAGNVPNPSQARTAGAAMGQAAANMIAARNTRLAVRTI